MKISVKGLILFLCIPTLILVLAELRKHSISSVDYNKYPVVMEWESLGFQKIEQSSAFFKMVQNTELSTNSLSEIQRINLFESVYNMMIGLNDGSYDKYRQFRTPTPSQLNPLLFNEKNRQMLINGAKALMAPGETVPDDFEKYVRVMTTRMNDGRGLTNYWIGVCLTNAFITIDERTNLAPDLMLDVRKAARVGLTRPPLFFIPNRNAGDILSENKKLIYATITMVVTHTQPDPPFRVYVRFFWDDKYSSWVPLEYVSAFSPEQKWSMVF